MSKKLISLFLTVVMVASAFSALMAVEVSAGGTATTPVPYLDVDYENMTAAEFATHLQGFGIVSIDTDSSEGAGSITLDAAEKALALDVGHTTTDDTSNKGLTFRIPLTNTIDTTTGRKYYITIKMKLPQPAATVGSGFDLKGFPIVSYLDPSSQNYGVGSNDNNIGLSMRTWGATNYNVSLYATAPKTFTNAEGETVTVGTANGTGNEYAKNFWGYYNESNTWTSTYTGSNHTAYSFTTRDTVLNDGEYVTYRWEVDPATATYKMFYSTDGNKWVQAYGDLIDNYSGQTEYGTLPMYSESSLKGTVKSIGFLGQNNTTDTNDTYYIKSIRVDSEETYVAPKYSWSLKDEDGEISSEKYSVTNATASVTEADGFTFTVEKPDSSYKTATVDFDIDDITLGDRPVEIVLDDVQFASGYYEIKGFPNLVPASGDATIFGFSTNYTDSANSRYSVRLPQALTHNGLEYYLGSTKIGSKFKFSAKVVGGEEAASTADSTVYNNYTDPTLMVGSSDGTASTAIGASKDKYDFKFVIDPVANTYRYYQKAATSDEWSEIYNGLARYPISFSATDTATTSGYTNVLPADIAKLRMSIARVAHNNSENQTFKIGNITVNELDEKDGFESKIEWRDYTITSNASEDDTCGVSVTAKVANYTGSIKEDAQIFLAVYNADGKLEAVVPTTVDLAVGDNTVAFSSVTLPSGRYKIQGNDSNIWQDYYTYKVFVWENLSNIRPLAKNAPVIAANPQQ